MEREERGPFLCCVCTRDRTFRKGIIAHVNTDHKRHAFNLCSNTKCLRSVFLEPKSEHIHITHEDVAAFFAAGGVAEAGREDVRREDVLAALAAAKRASKKARKDDGRVGGKAEKEIDVLAEKKGGTEVNVAVRKEGKKQRQERRILARENIRRLHSLFSS